MPDVSFANCYEDAGRANAYATLEFANTYYLAFRDLPKILTTHVTGESPGLRLWNWQINTVPAESSI